MEKVNLILEQVVFSNTVKEYGIAIILFFALFIAFRLFRKIAITKIKLLTQNTKNNFDDLIIEIFENIPKVFYWFVSFFLATKSLTMPILLNITFNNIFIIFVVFEIVLAVKKIIKYFSHVLSKKADDGKKVVFKIGAVVVTWIVYIIAFLFLLSSFGIDITAAIAGLGVGGIAIGFALKEILADLFSYFTILLDKPIEEGDYITVGNKGGTVKKIGIKTTRLVGLDGREVIVSNNTISSELIDNSKRREYRRVKFTLGLAYETPAEKLKKIKPAVEKILEQEKKGEFLRVFFNNFGDSALEFVIDYKLFPDTYDEYAQAKERINFAILEFCEREEINIAYPTMTIYSK